MAVLDFTGGFHVDEELPKPGRAAVGAAVKRRGLARMVPHLYPVEEAATERRRPNEANFAGR